MDQGIELSERRADRSGGMLHRFVGADIARSGHATGAQFREFFGGSLEFMEAGPCMESDAIAVASKMFGDGASDPFGTATGDPNDRGSGGAFGRDMG
jgi:hypothetical protein